MATGTEASQGSAQATDLPAWAASTTSILQCGPVGGGPSAIDGRTYCTFPGPDLTPVYNLLTFDDQLGVSLSPSPPSLAPVRPEVARHYIIPALTPANTPEGATANNAALQTAIDTLASNQASCAPADYMCPDRSGSFIPCGTFYVSKTIDVPGTVQLQIVGTGQSDLAWLPYGEAEGGADGATDLPSGPVLKLHAPSHVAIRDRPLRGAGYQLCQSPR